MLARNFMSAADLRITDEAYEALITFLGMAERGEVKHEPLNFNIPYNSNLNHTGTVHYINMMMWNITNPSCGTVSCIGGSMEILMGKDMDSNDMSRMNELFHPMGGGGMSERWNSITIPQVSQAIRNFLATGKPNWKEVVSG